jgi:hypothetical protein
MNSVMNFPRATLLRMFTGVSTTPIALNGAEGTASRERGVSVHLDGLDRQLRLIS